MKKVECPVCRAEISASDQVCPYCGSTVQSTEQTSVKRRKMVRITGNTVSSSPNSTSTASGYQFRRNVEKVGIGNMISSRNWIIFLLYFLGIVGTDVVLLIILGGPTGSMFAVLSQFMVIPMSILFTKYRTVITVATSVIIVKDKGRSVGIPFSQVTRIEISRNRASHAVSIYRTQVEQPVKFKLRGNRSYRKFLQLISKSPAAAQVVDSEKPGQEPFTAKT